MRDAEHPRVPTQITVTFEPEAFDDLEQVARQKGLLPTTLIQAWVREHLEREKRAQGQRGSER
jgi:hypothetical protein